MGVQVTVLGRIFNVIKTCSPFNTGGSHDQEVRPYRKKGYVDEGVFTRIEWKGHYKNVSILETQEHRGTRINLTSKRGIDVWKTESVFSRSKYPNPGHVGVFRDTNFSEE